MLYRLKSVARLLLGFLLRVMPACRHCVVYGWPDTEGNSVEVLRYLVRHYNGRIYWFVSRPAEDLIWLLADLEGCSRVRCVNKGTWRALLLFLTAEAAFYTHGLFLSPTPGRRRTFVNLWHGDGPKRTENNKFKITVGASLLVSGTRLWGEDKRIYFGMTSEDLAVVGNPRIDQFSRPASDSSLVALGLDPHVPFILWLPTYRDAKVSDKLSWQDGTRLSLQSNICEALQLMETVAVKNGMRLLLKPHPMEADQYQGLGIKIIDDSQLTQAHISFYQLMARSGGLITDYSSVWTDYLVLHRPIGFFCPDLAEYQKKRGLNVPNFEELLPGPLLSTQADMVRFISTVPSGQMAEDSRERSISLTGAITQSGATSRLFVEVNRRRQTAGLPKLIAQDKKGASE